MGCFCVVLCLVFDKHGLAFLHSYLKEKAQKVLCFPEKVIPLHNLLKTFLDTCLKRDCQYSLF